MATKTHYEGLFAAPGARLIAGSCTLNGASAPTGAKGAGLTFSRSGAGEITVTLTDDYVGLLAADGWLVENLATSTKRAFVKTVNTVTRAVTICTQSTAGTAGDLSSCELHVLLVVRDTSLTK